MINKYLKIWIPLILGIVIGVVVARINWKHLTATGFDTIADWVDAALTFIDFMFGIYQF